MQIPNGIKLPNEYDIVACERCGNCYADTLATEAGYNDYYQHHNYYGNGWQYNSSSYADKAVISRILKQYFSLHTEITDMGCGNGELLSFLQDDGFSNLVGIDPSETSIKDVISNGFRGIIGSVYDKPKKQTFKTDIIVLAMVLEHLLTPEKALKNIKDNYLNKNGYILLTWPRFEDLMIDESPILNNFNHEHINYFSVRTLDLLMKKIGFERVCSHIGHATQRRKFTTLSNVVLYHLSGTDTPVNSVLADAINDKDYITAQSIAEYIDRMQIHESKLIEHINKFSENKDKVAIWGTGAYMMHLFSVSNLSKCNIACFIDNNELKREQKIFGFDVNSPDYLKDFDGTVLITSMLYVDDIIMQMKEAGVNCKLLY